MSSEECYIDVDCVGELTGMRYVGQFEVKLFLTLRDKAEAGKVRTKALKDISDQDDVYYLLTLLSNLNTHIIKKPFWWGEDGTELKDNEPIIETARQLRLAQQAEVDSKKPKEEVPPPPPAVKKGKQ